MGAGPINTFSFSYVQVKFDIFVAGEQIPCTGDVIVVDVHVAEVEGDRLQGQIDLPGHQVQVVYVGRKSEVGIGTALVG